MAVFWLLLQWLSQGSWPWLQRQVISTSLSLSTFPKVSRCFPRAIPKLRYSEKRNPSCFKHFRRLQCKIYFRFPIYSYTSDTMRKIVSHLTFQQLWNQKISLFPVSISKGLIKGKIGLLPQERAISKAPILWEISLFPCMKLTYLLTDAVIHWVLKLHHDIVMKISVSITSAFSQSKGLHPTCHKEG